MQALLSKRVKLCAGVAFFQLSQLVIIFRFKLIYFLHEASWIYVYVIVKLVNTLILVIDKYYIVGTVINEFSPRLILPLNP